MAYEFKNTHLYHNDVNESQYGEYIIFIQVGRWEMLQ